MCFNLRVTNASKLVVQENVSIKIDPIMMLDYVYSVLNDYSSYDTAYSSFFDVIRVITPVKHPKIQKISSFEILSLTMHVLIIAIQNGEVF